MKVGLVSDTHARVDPKLAPLFRGCALILHAGDLVKPDVLATLKAVAPVTAVRGNNDLGPAFDRLPETALVAIGPLTALVVHDLGAPDRPKPPARAILARRRPELVVHGHSHRPGAERVGATLFVNPGSAGPRRFSLPRTAAVLEASARRVRLVFFDLSGEAPVPFGAPVEEKL